MRYPLARCPRYLRMSGGPCSLGCRRGVWVPHAARQSSCVVGKQWELVGRKLGKCVELANVTVTKIDKKPSCIAALSQRLRPLPAAPEVQGGGVGSIGGPRAL